MVMEHHKPFILEYRACGLTFGLAAEPWHEIIVVRGGQGGALFVLHASNNRVKLRGRASLTPALSTEQDV